jgi:hypothetical protein
MENKVINLQINDNINATETAVKSLKAQLREAQNEVNTLSDKFGATSKEAVEAAKQAAILKDRIGDAKSLTDAFNPDAKFKSLSGSLNGVAGGFSVVTGAMGAFGTSSKAVEEQLLKVQSAMALASGLQAIGESVDSFKQLGAVVKSYSVVQKAITAGQWLWNTAMAANPIGLLVAGIAALIAAGVALTNYFKSSAAETAANTKAVNDNKKALENQATTLNKNSSALQTKQSQELAMAKASGMSASAIRALELKLIDEKIAYEKSARAIAFNTYEKNKNKLASLQAAGADAELVKKQTEITNDSVKQVNKQNENLQKAYDERTSIQNRHQVEIRQSQTNSNKEIADKNREAANKAKEAAAEAAKKEADELKKIKEEKLSKDMQSAKDAAAILDELNKAKETPAEKENREYLAKKAILDANNLSTEELNKKHLDNLAIIKKSDDDKKAEAEKIVSDKKIADAKELADKLLAQEKAVADGKKAIQEATLSNIEGGLGVLKTLFAGNEAIQKGLIIGESAVGIARIIIGTQAADAADTAAAALMGPFGVGYLATKKVLNRVSAGIGIASNIAATSKALSALGGGGAPSAGAGASSGGGGGSVTMPPNFNVVGASSTNQLAQTIGNQQNTPVQAYVVSNDVTTAQALDRNIIKGASL